MAWKSLTDLEQDTPAKNVPLEQGQVEFYEGLLNKIVDFVRKVGVSYPGEIADSLMLKQDVVYVHVKVGVMQKKLIRLDITEAKIPHILHKRIRIFWKRGIRGYETFKRLWLVTVPCEICKERASTIRAIDRNGNEWNICQTCYNIYKI